jgi:phage shock protein PspC (stress-responsive transcriptional regulator)
MTMSDELSRLADLHQRGALTDDEFARAKARVLAGQDAGVPGPVAQAVNGLRLSSRDRWIGGVCGGLAEATSMPPWAWRLLFVVLMLCGGSGLLVYLLLWVLVPREPYGLPPPRSA